MATEFRSFESLRRALADAAFEQPPAIVCNAHVTGLSVARALKRHDVPVVAVDRNDSGVAPLSDAVDFAGRVTYPLDDREGFREDIEALAAEIESDPVAFPCMDEWVHAFAGTEPEGVVRPFADREGIDAVLNKESLYETAERLGVPHPETYRLSETDPEAAADELGFPLVVKPALKREFEEAVGTNVVEVSDREEFLDIVARARDADIAVMAQEKVPVVEGEDCSLASYRSPDGGALSVVGNAAARYPRGYGTSCLVRRADAPEVEERALRVLDETGYHGISEAEFVYDGDRETYVLLDINTRPWKWIRMPVEAGANLPMAAYADATGASYEADGVRDATWVSLADYLSGLAETGFRDDLLDYEDWAALLSGDFELTEGLTTAVYRPSDPAPAYRLLETEFGEREYYCSC